MPVTVKCAWCGKEKKVRPSQIEKQENFFCNRNCMGKWREGNIRGKNHPNFKEKIRKTCLNCGKIFYVKPYQSDRIFCSRGCISRYRYANDNQPYKDRDWLYREYVIKKKPSTQISKELGVHKTTICKWIRRLEIETRDQSSCQNPKKEQLQLLQDKKWVYREYAINKKSIQDMANMLGTSKSVVANWLKKHKIKVRDYEDYCLDKNPNLAKLADKKWLYQKYVVEKWAMNGIAQHLGCSFCAVDGWVRKHGFRVRGISEAKINPNAKLGVLNSESEFRKLYEKIKSISAMAEYLNCGETTVARRCERFGVDTSKFEWQKLCTDSFNNVLVGYSYKTEKTFDWLRSDIGRKLRVDLYYPELKLCVEFDGVQHFMPIFFSNDMDADAHFRRTQLLDSIKNKLIPERGLKLLRFRYDEPLTREHILKRLSEVGVCPEDIPKKNVVNA